MGAQMFFPTAPPNVEPPQRNDKVDHYLKSVLSDHAGQDVNTKANLNVLQELRNDFCGH